MLFGRKLQVIGAGLFVGGVVLAVVAALVLSSGAGLTARDEGGHMSLGVMVAGGLAALFLVVGLVLFLVGRSSVRRVAWLRANGREIWAEVTSVEPDSSVTHNDRPTYFVHATWRDLDGSTHTAKSARLVRNPALQLHTRRRVRVFVHPRNPDNTLVDIPGA